MRVSERASATILTSPSTSARDDRREMRGNGGCERTWIDTRMHTNTGAPMRADTHAQADRDALGRAHAHTLARTHVGIKQTQSEGYTDMSSSL